MAKLLKLRRGTTTQHASFTGAEGEVTIDTTKDTAVVHDGSTQAGHPLARENMANVSSASIAGRLGTDSIATTKIAAGALPTDVTVASANIVNGTIASADIGTDQINNTHIADDAIQRPMIADDAVNGDKIADSSITSAKILDGSVARGDIADEAIDFAKFQHISQNQILGRTASGSGDVTTLSAANVRSMINVEDGATGDQSNAEIRTAVEAASDSNVFTDADHSKLNGIEASATADQSAAEIRTLVESATDSNVFTDADHSKLNAIEASATADQTAAEILAAVLTVDGSGSSLDADTLDGTQGSGFLRSDTADTATADITFSGGAGAITLAANSDIRGSHGSWTGEADGKIQWHSNHMYLQTSTGYWIFRNSSGSEKAYLDGNGNFVATGNVTAYSDKKLKEKIKTIPNALETVQKLRGVNFVMKETGIKGTGVIAQEVEKVVPEVVLDNIITDPTREKEDEVVKSVDYGKLVGVLIESIKELKAELDEHKKKCGGK